MAKSKLKILMISEASFLSSGFSNYTRELLTRLYNTGKYEIAEFACYGFVNDPRDKSIPWKYYANAVKDSDPRYSEYNSRGDNQFGRWRFEKVLLDFRPDVTINIKDYWMAAFESLSPLRKYVHQIWMPTVDSAPQQEEWIDNFIACDSVFTYSDWGAQVLKDQSNGKINYIDTVSPGVDLNTFKPLDKSIIKDNLGIPKDSIIIGSVMRNQKRKLFPELMKSFRQVLDRLENENYDLGAKLYLYLHTSYPDAGWDLPELLKEHRISNKVLFTYLCRKCSRTEASVFVGPQKVCKNCLEKSMTFSSVTNGISDQKLSEVYNTFDLYVQYAICLGKDEPIRIKRNNNILWMPISQVTVGDEAWTHKNRWKRISHVWENLPKSHNKKVLKLSVHSDYETLLATENHEFIAYTNKELNIKHRSVKENIGYYFYNKRDLPSPGKYELKDLKPGDVLSYPIDDTVVDIDKIDISKEIDCSNYLILDSFIETVSDYAYPRYINIDNDFCRFVGLFAADGCWETNQGRHSLIKITSSINEKTNHSLAHSCMSRLGVNNANGVRVYKNRAAQDNLLHSSIHSKVFAGWFKKHEHKRLPEWCMLLPVEKQKHVLQGLFMGDGSYLVKNNISLYNTISHTLADQIKTILRRLRIHFNVSIVTKKGNRKPQYRFEVPGNIKNGEFLTNRIRNTRNAYYQNQHLIQIKNIVESDYNDSVWCVTVEDDHTITTKLAGIFNCEGFGCPQVEAGACGIPVATINYSAMVDVINKLEAISIEPKTYFKELETKAIRVYPDNDQLTNEIIYFISQPEEHIQKKKNRVRHLTEKHYNWDDIVKKWEKHLDHIDETFRANWDAPPTYLEPIKDLKELDHKKYFHITQLLCNHYLKDKTIFASSTFLNLLQHIDYSFGMHGTNIQKYHYEDIIKYINTMIENHNQSEHARVNKIQFNDDFIEYAKIKHSTK